MGRPVKRAPKAVKKPVKRAAKKPYRMRVNKGTPHLQRMTKHVYNSLREQGKTHAEAERIAYARVNQYRRKHGLLVEDVGRDRWYPGKPAVKGRVARAAQLIAEGGTDRARVLLTGTSRTRSSGKGRRF